MKFPAIFRGVMIAALAALVCAAPVFADDSNDSFTLHNRTGRTMKALFVAPTSQTDSWGSDILNEDIADGNDVKVSFPRSSSECQWDVRGEFEDGTYAEVREVDMCTVWDVTFNP
jgi:hypothetical protein